MADDHQSGQGSAGKFEPKEVEGGSFHHFFPCIILLAGRSYIRLGWIGFGSNTFFAGGNHFTAAGVAEAYPNPIPVPAKIPNPMMAGRAFPGVEKLVTIMPAAIRIAPVVAIIPGPSLS